MSSKENAAIHQLFERLECRYALRVLWALRDGHPQTFRLLQDSVGGITPNTLNTRIKELREAGLMTHGSDGYSVTPSGTDLLKRLSDLQAFASKWVANRPAVANSNKTLHATRRSPITLTRSPSASKPVNWSQLAQAGDYAGVSFARLVEIAEALAVTVHYDVRLASAS